MLRFLFIIFTAACSIMITRPAIAVSEVQNEPSSTSLGDHKASWQNNTPFSAQKKQGVLFENSLSNSLKGLPRQQVLQIRQQMTKNQVATLANKETKSTRIESHSFSIYQGYAQLIEDFDEDGFYQTFSVTFDADVHHPEYVLRTHVYADLYLSKNGGDWIHYYTTDSFVIEGDSQDDSFEVYTTLNQGYKSDNYDVLIDLYEVGYDDIVATYSAYDTNDLYALPLESSDYDPDYIEYSDDHHHGGSMLFSTLVILAVMFVYRQRKTILKRNSTTM